MPKPLLAPFPAFFVTLFEHVEVAINDPDSPTQIETPVVVGAPATVLIVMIVASEVHPFAFVVVTS